MRNGRAMTLCYNKRGTAAILDLTPCEPGQFDTMAGVECLRIETSTLRNGEVL
jgi:hypothetical protein